MSKSEKKTKTPKIQILSRKMQGKKLSVRVTFFYPELNRTVTKGFTMGNVITTKEDLVEKLKELYEDYRPRPLPKGLNIDKIDW